MKKKFPCAAVWRYRQRPYADCFVVTCKLFFYLETFCMLILQRWTAIIHEACDLKTLMLSMYFICIFGGAFLVNMDAGYYSGTNWKWREIWTYVPTKLALADPVENWRNWVSGETGWGIMECKWNDRQGQRGQNCHVVLSGFTNELTEEKADSQAQRVRRSLDYSERQKDIWKCEKVCKKIFYAPLVACFVASAVCLSSREVVIKVCCKICRIKTVGEVDLGSVSGWCAVRDYGLETICIRLVLVLTGSF